MSAPSLEELLSGVRKGEAEEATAAGSGELKEKPVAAAAAGNAAGGQEEEENVRAPSMASLVPSPSHRIAG